MIYLQSGLTVYRTSDIVERLEEISKDVGQNILEPVASAFSNLKHSYKDDLASLEIAICDIFTHRNSVEVVPEKYAGF